MPPVSNSLRRELRNLGITNRAIDAVWPEWWSREAEGSRSAVAELRYTVARRLGISPGSLFDGPPRFVWRDEAKFKNLGAASPEEAEILTSFGMAVGRYLTSAVEVSRELPGSASVLRSAVLGSFELVNLGGLLATCWSLGIPVIQLRLFPLAQKRMHALSVRLGDRYAVLIGRESKYQAQIAYILAHELGHIASGHLRDSAALLDIADPLTIIDPDDEEESADNFAMEVLTGDSRLTVESSVTSFSARQLAQAALETSSEERIDPGILALCLAHATGRWRQGFAALKLMAPGPEDVGGKINDLARQQMRWEALSEEGREFLEKVMAPSAS